MARRPGDKRRIAAAIAAFLAATLTVEVVFAALNWEYYAARGIATVEHFLYIALFGVIGPLIAYRRPENPIGWLLAAAAILRQVSALEAVVDISLANGAEASWVHIFMRGLWPSGFTFALLALAIVVFPAGSLPSRRWRPVVWLVGLMAIIDIGAFNLYPAFDARRIIAESGAVSSLVPTVDWGPVSFDRHIRQLPELEVVQAVFIGMLVAILALAVSAQIHRWRHGTHSERQQVKWLTPALMLWGVGLAATVPPFGMPFEWLILLVVPFPICMTIAILYYRTYDIDRIISRTLVYGALSIGIFAIYALIAAGLGLATESRFPVEVAIVVTAVLAFAFQPARRWLQRIADRWVFGERPTPLEAVVSLESGWEETSTIDLSTHLADTIRVVGRLRWSSVVIPPSPERISGEQTKEVELTVDIRHAGERFGEIKCGPKARGRFNNADVNLVRALAAQTALVLSNSRMTSRLVQAQEAERRRIERNIHDGAQQELVALIAKLTLARTGFRLGLLEEATLEELQRDAAHILTDLRSLAQGIHPTVLTDGGIVEAVEDRCKRLPIEVVVDIAPELRERRFDDDVEGASYFFVIEGLTNVLKHAAATSAHIGIQSINQQLKLHVSDNGEGFNTGSAPLNGLVGLSDRFRALGGSISFTSEPGRGTVLEGRLPVGRP
jgi:signal transduction histidine kinase